MTARRIAVAVAVGLFAFTPAAHASGAEDGEAGLRALSRGSYDEAIGLFTRALKSGELSADDRELAHLNRGKAYLGKGDKADALPDLQEAFRLKPDDAEAREALADASRSGPPAAAAEQPAGSPFGILADMAGHFYWFRVVGSPSNNVFFQVNWVVADQTLATSIRSKGAVLQAAEYQYDAESRKILVASVTGQTLAYGTAGGAAPYFTAFTYFKNTPVRDTFSRGPDGSVRQHEQKYSDGVWRDAGDIDLVEVSRDVLEAQGLVKRRK